MEVFRSEVRAGILIMVSFVLLVVGIFLISDVRTMWEHKRNLTFLFQYADGITKGSPVWYAGFEVGEVSGIRIHHGEDERIAVNVTIDPEAVVRKDSKVYIRNLGMMGAKYVEISPGSADSPALPEGGVLKGENPSSLSQVIETGQQIAAELQGTIQEIHGLVQEIRSNSPIQEAIKNTNAFLVEMRERGKDLESLFGKVDALLGTTQTSIHDLAGSFGETSQTLTRTTEKVGDEAVVLLGEFRETNQGLKTLLARLEQQIMPVIGQAHKDLAEVEGLIKGARSVVEANDQNLYQLVYHLKEASRHIDALSEDLRAHPWKVLWKGEGTSDGGGSSKGPDEWREKGRIGRYGKE